jgi:WD40 repeat protein
MLTRALALRCHRHVAMVLVLLVGAAVMSWSSGAWAVGYGPDSFLVAGFGSNNVAVYDRNFVFQGNLDSNLPSALGLDFTPTEQAIAGSQNSGIIRRYNSAGATLASFNTAVGESPVDVKYGPGDRLYVGTQSANGVHEYSLAGAPLRSFGSSLYDSVAVLPGGVLWAGGNKANVGRIDVFSIATGLQTNTIVLDNSQNEAESMYYSPLSNTVLTCGQAVTGIWERSVTGTFIRRFTAPGFTESFGVTRGPDGDVYATSTDTNQVFHWKANGTFVNAFNLGNSLTPCGIIWAGTIPEPASLSVMFVGAAGLMLRSRRFATR